MDLGLAAKVRPTVVISVPADDTDRALVTLVPHTTSPRGTRWAPVSVPILRAGVFDAQNLVTVPHAKLVRNLGKLSAAQLALVERATATWLGLSLTTSHINVGDGPDATQAALASCAPQVIANVSRTR